jgi:hypothetical protein
MGPEASVVESSGSVADAPAVDFISPWGELSRARHELFQVMVFDTLRSEFPQLLRFIENSGAQVLARQRAFYLAIPPGSPDWIEIPDMSARLQLTPWVEEDETAH